MSRIRIFVLAVTMVVVATAFAACGSGGGSSEDPQKVVDEATFEGIESGDIDLTVTVKSSGEQSSDMKLSVSGPFQSEGKENLPQLDMTVSAKGNANGENIDFEGGLTLLSDRAFIEYKGSEYEVDPTTFGFVKSGFEQAQQEGGQQGAGATACKKAAEGLKLEEFVENVTSEGGADVDGTSTTKVSGDLNISGAVDAVIKLTENPACSSQLEAAGPLPLSELNSAKGELEKALKKAHADVYVGDDHIVRKVVADFTVQESGESADVSVELAIGKVNEDQNIKAPSGAKPLEELFQQLGVNPLELLEGASGGGGEGLGGLLEGLGGSSGSESSGSTELLESPEYLECLQEVETPADLQKCANLAQ